MVTVDISSSAYFTVNNCSFSGLFKNRKIKLSSNRKKYKCSCTRTVGIQACSGVLLKSSVQSVPLQRHSVFYLLLETIFWGFKAKAALFSWQFLQHRSIWFSETASSSLSLSLFPLNWWMCILFRRTYCVRGKNSSNHPVPCTGRFLRIWLSVHLLPLPHFGFYKILATVRINKTFTLMLQWFKKNPEIIMSFFTL